MTQYTILTGYAVVGTFLWPFLVSKMADEMEIEGVAIALSIIAAALWLPFLIGWFVGVMLARAGNRHPEVGE